AARCRALETESHGHIARSDRAAVARAARGSVHLADHLGLQRILDRVAGRRLHDPLDRALRPLLERELLAERIAHVDDADDHQTEDWCNERELDDCGTALVGGKADRTHALHATSLTCLA